MGDYLLEKLKAFPQIKELRGRGLMIGIEMPEEFAYVKKDLLLKHNIFTGEAKPNTIRLLPALNITKVEANLFLKAFAKTLN
jgi:acetylornithine/N-succinyldiaminopimelate aminotransferase